MSSVSNLQASYSCALMDIQVAIHTFSISSFDDQWYMETRVTHNITN